MRSELKDLNRSIFPALNRRLAFWQHILYEYIQFCPEKSDLCSAKVAPSLSCQRWQYNQYFCVVENPTYLENVFIKWRGVPGSSGLRDTRGT